eukprot:15349393-Ditylum_brightwellii.AAC.1
MQNGSSAHNQRHASADTNTTNTGKVEDIDFKIPCLSWLYLQLSPNNEYQELAGQYTAMMTPCLEPCHAMSYNRADDKASCAVGRAVPVSAASKQSTKVPMSAGDAPDAPDHDFICERVQASVLHSMNLSRDPSDSLYSDGPKGHG